MNITDDYYESIFQGNFNNNSIQSNIESNLHLQLYELTLGLLSHLQWHRYCIKTK